MSFQISEKVVCVKINRATVKKYKGPGVRKGAVYVIRDYWYPDATLAPHGPVQLVGFPEHYNDMGMRCGWCPTGFRRLDEVKAENAQRQEEPALC